MATRSPDRVHAVNDLRAAVASGNEHAAPHLTMTVTKSCRNERGLHRQVFAVDESATATARTSPE
jgi:hypothetical protein